VSLLRNELVLRAARRLPEPVRRRGRRLVLGQDTPRWGNFRRAAPFSERWGWDRGTPVDRVYIEAFLAAHADDVRGEVLEVRDSQYTGRFGGTRVTASHVLDVDADNPRATIVADLSVPGALPEGRFDCVILTQVLQYVGDPETALANAWGALAPGGVLLVTVPTISRLDYPDGVSDLWRWTPAGLEHLVRRFAPGARLDVEGHGNLPAATAFLHGLAAEELRRDELELFDPLFLVCAAARAVKPPA
jgi:SAM-dependent methyltransferase